MKVAQVELPAISVTTNTYIPFAVINVQLVYATPLRVAITQVLLSEKVMLTHVAYIVPLVTPANVGETLSIRVTVAAALHVFHAASWNWNVNELLPVNVY